MFKLSLCLKNSNSNIIFKYCKTFRNSHKYIFHRFDLSFLLENPEQVEKFAPFAGFTNILFMHDSLVNSETI